MARQAAKAKKRKSRKSTISYADAIQTLKKAKARYKEISCADEINLVDFIRLIEQLKRERISLKKVCFVALNAPFMRRAPIPPV